MKYDRNSSKMFKIMSFAYSCSGFHYRVMPVFNTELPPTPSGECKKIQIYQFQPFISSLNTNDNEIKARNDLQTIKICFYHLTFGNITGAHSGCILKLLLKCFDLCYLSYLWK